MTTAYNKNKKRRKIARSGSFISDNTKNFKDDIPSGVEELNAYLLDFDSSTKVLSKSIVVPIDHEPLGDLIIEVNGNLFPTVNNLSNLGTSNSASFFSGRNTYTPTINGFKYSQASAEGRVESDLFSRFNIATKEFDGVATSGGSFPVFSVQSSPQTMYIGNRLFISTRDFNNNNEVDAIRLFEYNIVSDSGTEIFLEVNGTTVYPAFNTSRFFFSGGGYLFLQLNNGVTTGNQGWYKWDGTNDPVKLPSAFDTALGTGVPVGTFYKLREYQQNNIGFYGTKNIASREVNLISINHETNVVTQLFNNTPTNNNADESAVGNSRYFFYDWQGSGSTANFKRYDATTNTTSTITGTVDFFGGGSEVAIGGIRTGFITLSEHQTSTTVKALKFYNEKCELIFTASLVTSNNPTLEVSDPRGPFATPIINVDDEHLVFISQARNSNNIGGSPSIFEFESDATTNRILFDATNPAYLLEWIE